MTSLQVLLLVTVHMGKLLLLFISLCNTLLPVVADLQAGTLEVVLDKQITICSTYLPPQDSFTNTDIQSLLD